LRIDFLEDGVARYRWIPPGEEPSDFSWAVRRRGGEDGPVPFAFEGAGPGRVGFKCGALQVLFDRVTGAVHFVDAGGAPLVTTLARGGVRRRGGERRFEIVHPDGVMTFGTGERSGRMNRRGSVVRMWNSDAFLYDRLTDPLYAGIPWWIGLRDGTAYGI